jgi:hypothetical protein
MCLDAAALQQLKTVKGVSPLTPPSSKTGHVGVTFMSSQYFKMIRAATMNSFEYAVLPK